MSVFFILIADRARRWLNAGFSTIGWEPHRQGPVRVIVIYTHSILARFFF